LASAAERAARGRGKRWSQFCKNSAALLFSDNKERRIEMLKTFAATGLLVALAGCAVAPGYDYGYAQPPYYYGYGPAYEPAYGGVNIGVWSGGGRDHYGDRGHWHGGGEHGNWRHGGGGGHGNWPHGGGGGHGGHGGGHGGGGHGGR
jgi:hypothetical protein